MSAHVNVCVYSPSNLLFLAGSAGLLPQHWDSGADALPLSACCWCEGALSSPSQHCTELFSWFCSLIHHAATQRPGGLTTLLKLLAKGFSPVKEQNNNKKTPPMLLNPWVLHQAHIRHGCISVPERSTRPVAVGFSVSGWHWWWEGLTRSKWFPRLNIWEPPQRHSSSLQMKAFEIPTAKLHRQI